MLLPQVIVVFSSVPIVFKSLTAFCFSYTKPKGQLPDYSAPIVLNAEKNTVDDLCLKIHKSLQKDFKK